MATIIEMPKLSDTMSVGTVVKWHKKVGDIISNGDVLAEIETDKATMELECFDDGTLLKIFVEEGHEVPIGSPLAAVGEEGESVEELPSATLDEQNAAKDKVEEEKKPSKQSETEEQPIEESETEEQPIEEEPLGATLAKQDDETSGVASGVPISSERILASPLAKKIARDENLDLSKVPGTGPSGRITKKDVLSFVQAPTESQSPATSPSS